MEGAGEGLNVWAACANLIQLSAIGADFLETTTTETNRHTASNVNGYTRLLVDWIVWKQADGVLSHPYHSYPITS